MLLAVDGEDVQANTQIDSSKLVDRTYFSLLHRTASIIAASSCHSNSDVPVRLLLAYLLRTILLTHLIRSVFKLSLEISSHDNFPLLFEARKISALFDNIMFKNFESFWYRYFLLAFNSSKK